MGKWAEVTVSVCKTFAVEIEDDETLEHAKGYALEEFWGDAEIVDCALAENESQAASIRRCADEVLRVSNED